MQAHRQPISAQNIYETVDVYTFDSTMPNLSFRAQSSNKVALFANIRARRARSYGTNHADCLS